MSLIVYGPQGCGKTTHAEKLRKHFGLDSVFDADDLQCRGDIYRYMSDPAKGARIKSMNALILTNREPPPGYESRRVVSFDRALHCYRNNLPLEA